MSKDAAHHVHESPRVMTWPLIVLALLTLFAGAAVGVPSEHGTPFARFLAPVLPLHEGEHGGVAGIMLLVLSVIVVIAGIVLAWLMYLARPLKPDALGRPSSVVHRLLLNAWYVDWLYDRAIVRPLYAAAVFLAGAFDLGIVDGLVNALGRAVAWGSAGLRQLQTGYVMNYALTMLAGALVFVVYFLIR
jgi:NADH-quinone oxidoreductase subunit L